MVADADQPDAGWSHKISALAALIVVSATIARREAARASDPGLVLQIK
jgi:hypothetical protein